ncbi:unnamed protein product [Rhodiola kirilowii]
MDKSNSICSQVKELTSKITIIKEAIQDSTVVEVKEIY